MLGEAGRDCASPPVFLLLEWVRLLAALLGPLRKHNCHDNVWAAVELLQVAASALPAFLRSPAADAA